MDSNQQTNKDGNAANSQPNAPHASSSSEGSVVQKATQWLGNSSMSGMLGKMSTTQKVLGGALLLFGASSLLRGSKTSKGSKASKGNNAQEDTLHELLYFVNDRIEGYQRAVEESQDSQLTGYYKQLVSQSQQFANELNGYLQEQSGGRETGTTLKGKLYRRWMDAKAAITGSDEKAILGSNIYGEEWALKAYEDALGQKTLTGTLRQAVERQYAVSQSTYKRLQNLQDKQ